jgi:hypothetical protein
MSYAMWQDYFDNDNQMDMEDIGPALSVPAPGSEAIGMSNAGRLDEIEFEAIIQAGYIGDSYSLQKIRS